MSTEATLPKEVTLLAANLHSGYVEHQKAKRARQIEAKQRESQVGEIFRQGVKLANEYAREAVNYGYTTNTDPYNISVVTHPTTLKVGDEEVIFVVKAETFVANKKPPKLPIENYRRVSVFPTDETGVIDHSTDPIFHIKSDELYTKASEDNDLNEIQAASDIMSAIGGALQETHTPRSQLPQPEPTGVRNAFRTLTTIFRPAKS